MTEEQNREIQRLVFRKQRIEKELQDINEVLMAYEKEQSN